MPARTKDGFELLRRVCLSHSEGAGCAHAPTTGGLDGVRCRTAGEPANECDRGPSLVDTRLRSRPTVFGASCAVLGLVSIFASMAGPVRGENCYCEEGMRSAGFGEDAEALWAAAGTNGRFVRDEQLALPFSTEADPCGLTDGSVCCARGFTSGDYLDRGWYYFLDRVEYYYLDHAQYNLLGRRNYVLGHPAYPKWFERQIDQRVGFMGTGRVFWFGVCSYLPGSGSWGGTGGGESEEMWVAAGCVLGGQNLYFSQTAGDYLDRWRYHYLERGRYYYLDSRQYNLLGGLGYMYDQRHYTYLQAHSAYSLRYGGGYAPAGGYAAIPEPTTAVLIVIGALNLIRRKHRAGTMVFA